MLKSQKHALRSSEIRERLNAIAGLEGEAFTDEVRSESDKLADEFKQVESLYRASLVAESASADEQRSQLDAEGAELGELRGRVNVGRIVAAVLENRQTEGAEAEIQKHYNLGGHEIPASLLLEDRAVGTAVAPGNSQGNQQEIVPAVFPSQTSEAMGIERVSVPSGTAVFPTMTAPATGPDSVAEGATVADSAGTFDAAALGPKRIQASLTHSREDAASFPGMDAALRRNLGDALLDGLDKMALTLTDEGLLDFGADPTATAGVETFSRYLASVYAQVEGRFATNAMGVRLLIGAKTYAHASSVYRANQSDVPALEHLERVSAGVFVSATVAAPAANVQQAVFARGIGLRHAVQPVWEGVSIIADPFSESKDGNIRLTAVALANFKVTRAGGYTRHAYRLA